LIPARTTSTSTTSHSTKQQTVSTSTTARKTERWRNWMIWSWVLSRRNLKKALSLCMETFNKTLWSPNIPIKSLSHTRTSTSSPKPSSIHPKKQTSNKSAGLYSKSNVQSIKSATIVRRSSLTLLSIISLSSSFIVSERSKLTLNCIATPKCWTAST